MELAVVYDDFEPGTKRADEIFSYCKSFVIDKEQGSERTYYLNAWHEVNEFKPGMEFGIAGTEQYKRGGSGGGQAKSSRRHPRRDLYLWNVLPIRTH